MKEEDTGETLETRNQQLFLMEFLVGQVTIHPAAVQVHPADMARVMSALTCVRALFMQHPPLDISEKDLDLYRQPEGEQITFNSGKSLMFALTEQQCDNPPALFIEVILLKKPSPVEDVELGTARICLTDLFEDVADIAKHHPHRLPASKSLKDCYTFTTKANCTVAEMTNCVRLTCLGPTVITEFKIGKSMKEDPVRFKKQEGHKIFEVTGEEMVPPPKPQLHTHWKGCGCQEEKEAKQKMMGEGDGTNQLGHNAFSRGKRLVLTMGDKDGAGEEDEEERKPMKPMDPDKDYFTLKVGDKGVRQDRGKMILELVTPKQMLKYKVLPPYHEDVGVNTDKVSKKKKK